MIHGNNGSILLKRIEVIIKLLILEYMNLLRRERSSCLKRVGRIRSPVLIAIILRKLNNFHVKYPNQTDLFISLEKLLTVEQGEPH